MSWANEIGREVIGVVGYLQWILRAESGSSQKRKKLEEWKG